MGRVSNPDDKLSRRMAREKPAMVEETVRGLLFGRGRTGVRCPQPFDLLSVIPSFCNQGFVFVELRDRHHDQKANQQHF